MARAPSRSSPALAPVEMPGVWRGQEMAHAQTLVVPSGHALLDRQLPGGGWPRGNLVELLQARAEQPVWQLLLPALLQMLRQQAGPLLLIGPPGVPFGPSLRAQGLLPERLLWIRTEAVQARLWACEQALRCREVAAVLAWLPQADSDALRRLQLAAQPQQQLLFVLREQGAEHAPSPAPLRLLLQGAGDALDVQILKRRGPPMVAPLSLPARAPRLHALLRARQDAAAVASLARPAGDAAALPPAIGCATAGGERPHALDRAAAH